MHHALDLPTGPFTTSTAGDLGLSRRRLDRLVDERLVRRVLQGVYVRADVPDSVEVRAAAASLVLTPFVVACDRTAAWMLGIDTLDLRELEILPPLETSALRGHTRTRRTQCRPGVRDLATRDVTTIAGVLVTTPLRTALDLACHLPRREALAALDAFMRHYGLTHPQMLRELTRFAGRRGVVQARELVPVADPRAESASESWTRLAIIDAGLPVPDLQWRIEVDGRLRYRLDLAYPRHRVAVEYDGEEFHTSPEDRERDRARREWLREQGWTVIVVRKDDFSAEAVTRWTQEIADALREARPRVKRFYPRPTW